jgi:hypothetical protein
MLMKKYLDSDFRSELDRIRYETSIRSSQYSKNIQRGKPSSGGSGEDLSSEYAASIGSLTVKYERTGVHTVSTLKVSLELIVQSGKRHGAFRWQS